MEPLAYAHSSLMASPIAHLLETTLSCCSGCQVSARVAAEQQGMRNTELCASASVDSSRLLPVSGVLASWNEVSVCMPWQHIPYQAWSEVRALQQDAVFGLIHGGAGSSPVLLYLVK